MLKKEVFYEHIKGEYKTTVRTFDPREINRKIIEKYNTTLEKRSNKSTKKEVSQGQNILLNLRMPRNEDYSKPINNPFSINIIA